MRASCGSGSLGRRDGGVVGGRRGAVLAVAAAGVCGWAASWAGAQALPTYTWDSGGASPANPSDGTGAAVTWEVGDAFWSNGPADVAWPNDGGAVAVFGNNIGTAGDVYPHFAWQAAGVTFNPPGAGTFNLGAIDGGSLTLMGTTQTPSPRLTVSAASGTISAQILGSAGYTKAGSGTLVISQTANNYSGPIAVEAGTLEFNEGAGITVGGGTISGASSINLVNGGIEGAAGYPRVNLHSGNTAAGTQLGINKPVNVTFGAAVSGDYRAGIRSTLGANHTVSGLITVTGTTPGKLVFDNAGGALQITGNIDVSGAPAGSAIVFEGSTAQATNLASRIVDTRPTPSVDVIIRRTGTGGVSLGSTATIGSRWANTYVESGSFNHAGNNVIPGTTVVTLGKAGEANTVNWTFRTQTFAGLNSVGSGGTQTVNLSNAVYFMQLNVPAGQSHSFGTTEGGPTAILTGPGHVSKFGNGTQKLTGANTYTGNTNVYGGTLILGKDAWSRVLSATGAPKADQTRDGANIGANINALTQWGRLVFDYTGTTTPQAQVYDLLKTGYGAPEGPHFASGPIRSVTATQTGAPVGTGGASIVNVVSGADATRGLGWYDDGVSLLTVAYTYYGDLNLDRKVDGDDYALIDRHVAKFGAESAGVWVNGDVNYDGVVGVADYLIIDTTFSTLAPPAAAMSALVAQRQAQFGEEYVRQLVAAVPEPGAIGMGVAGLASLVGRRRRMR